MNYPRQFSIWEIIQERDRLRRENAELAAALVEARGWISQVDDKCWTENISLGGLTKRIPNLLQSDIGAAALRDLLAPTIELLEQLRYPAISASNNIWLEQELARLRALVKEAP